MSVTSELNKVTYAASGLSAYPVPFVFFDNTHLKVYVDDVLQTLGTHYSLTGANDPSGGELTFVAPPASGVVIILRDVPLKQENTFNEGGEFSAKVIERMFDKNTHADQQLNEKVERAIKMPLSSTTIDPQITGAATPGALIEVNEAGNGLKMGQSVSSYVGELNTIKGDALTAQTAAETAQGLAETAQAASEAAQLASETAQTAAELAETNAAGSASAAAGSASLAQQAADSVLFNDVIFITSAMSPIIVDNFYRGAMLACDCSLGPIVINLPEISTLDLSYPWTVSIKKTDSSGNSITVNRAGTNLIDEGTSKTIGSAGSGLTLIPDADPNPDIWTTAEFGAAAGNITTDRFSGDGIETDFTLSVAPGAENNTQVFIHGVYQQKNTYSISGVTLTFDEAPVAGVDNIEVNIGTVLPVGTPADGTVSLLKLDPPLQEKIISVAAYGRNGAGTLVSNSAFTTVMPTPTIVYDTHGALSTSGQFTVPLDGYYQISSTALFADASYAVGNNIQLVVRINSTNYHPLTYQTIPITGNFIASVSGTTVIHLLKDQVIDVVINNNRTGGNTNLITAATYNTVSIARVGY